jgi:hypothetical protein
MRRLLLLAGLAVVLALSVPAVADANTVDATCNGGSCSPWFNVNVTIEWQFIPSAPDSKTDDCNVTDVTTEGEHALDCGATWNDPAPPEFEHHSIDVKIDKTAPTGVTGAPDRPPDHNGWYTQPLSVPFSATSDNLSGVAGCDTVPYSGPDGVGLSVMGSCSDNAGNAAAASSATFNYDATPPVVSGADPSRPPDHNGWYNHPVGFTFVGTDVTSQIASCTSTTYSGPVDPSAAVNGACTDNAGNVGLGHQSLKYDDARPAAAQVQVTPGNHRVDVSWTLPGDANEVTLSRSRQGISAAPVVVYSGSGSSFLDRGLTNGVKYRYALTDIDQAGNSTTKVVPAIPTASSLRPFVGTVVSSPPRLTWKAVKRARYYNVQLYIGRKKVLSTWPRTASLQLTQRWNFRGRSYTLRPGHYRWYVWPGFGSMRANDYGKRIGRSSFRVVGS